jgi:hypothetical protein
MGRSEVTHECPWWWDRELIEMDVLLRDPLQGVVDADARVHGIANPYVDDHLRRRLADANWG